MPDMVVTVCSFARPRVTFDKPHKQWPIGAPRWCTQQIGVQETFCLATLMAGYGSRTHAHIASIARCEPFEKIICN